MDSSKEIQKIIATNLGVPTGAVTGESKASDFADWDSLRHLLIVIDIEQAFALKFDLAEIAGLDSVEKIGKSVV